MNGEADRAIHVTPPRGHILRIRLHDDILNSILSVLIDQGSFKKLSLTETGSASSVLTSCLGTGSDVLIACKNAADPHESSKDVGSAARCREIWQRTYLKALEAAMIERRG